MSETLEKASSSKTPRADFISLEHLFGSKTRARLLSLFLHHPERKFFVRELSREINAQVHAVRRELENLEKLLILKSGEAVEMDEQGKKVKKKYFWAERDAILFPELRSLILKAELFVESKLGEHIKGIGEFLYIALLGRLVGEEETPIDLFLVGEVSEERLKHLLSNLKTELGYEINFTLFSPEEYKFRRELGDRFLYSLFEAKKTVLIYKLDTLYPKPEL